MERKEQVSRRRQLWERVFYINRKYIYLGQRFVDGIPQKMEEMDSSSHLKPNSKALCVSISQQQQSSRTNRDRLELACVKNSEARPTATCFGLSHSNDSVIP